MAGLGDTLAAFAVVRRASPDRGQIPGRLHEVVAFGRNPGALRMRVHVPVRLAEPRSLVVVLHGCTQSPDDYAESAGWLALADRLGFVVLCPEQSRANNANLCFNWFQPGDTVRGAGEAASIRAMIQHAVDDHGVDRRRIFITGLSAGGAMANVMLATYPEVFCAGAIIAGLPYGVAADVREALMAMKAPQRRSAETLGDAVRAAASPPAGPWPRVSVWHGDEDRVVVPEAARQLAEQWCDVHGVNDREGDTSTRSPRQQITRWRSAQGEAVVELHRIAGMGHGAPISTADPEGCGVAGPYSLDVGVPSTLQIARDWGLAPVGVPQADAQTPRERPATSHAPSPAPFEAVLKADSHIGKVISDALRHAGLLP